MKILWVTTNFLHPTTKGGLIRTLEMLRRLHARHEIHFVALENPAEPEGPARSPEYCTRAYPYRHSAPARNTPGFYRQVAGGLFSPLPVAISRFTSSGLRGVLEDLMAREHFDSIVCDFLTPAANLPALDRAVLFQHNVETMIWRRHAQHGATPLHRIYFSQQARKMFDFERMVCQGCRHVVAVSEADSSTMKELFELKNVSAVPTGVDLAYFTPSALPSPASDLVFVGSMDWMPNIDGVQWFTREVLPLIRRRKPDCTLSIVGRLPGPEIRALAEQDPRIEVPGTVPDVRPYLWKSRMSIVPLRIGGGTRLKIYEAMAARLPVVSTSIGAEGLTVNSPQTIYLADEPAAFAEACLRLLEDESERQRLSTAGWKMVESSCSWEQVVNQFENILRMASLKPERVPAS